MSYPLRDPDSKECTRDPIFLLQSEHYAFTGVPRGMEWRDDAFVVTDESSLEEWVKPFLEYAEEDSHEGWENEPGWINSENIDFIEAAEGRTNREGYNLVESSWITVGVWLSRSEAEAWADAHQYRFKIWRVYCVPCDGKLKELLAEMEASA